MRNATKTMAMMRRFALVMAVMLALCAISASGFAQRKQVEPTKSAYETRDAANLNQALNVPGGTLEFQTDTNYPWIVDGELAISTNSGIPNSTSSVWTTVNAAAGDSLRFDFWSLGEGEEYVFDGLMLYIDGARVAQWGACMEWSSYIHPLTAGQHTIKFTYSKDYSNDPIGDLAMLDNVYVGREILPSAINASPVTVPLGRRANISYTVLPNDAFNKNVTFTSSNPSVASVDENGVVTGVSTGSATVTITSVAAPSVSTTVPVTVTGGISAIDLEGFVLRDFNSENLTGRWIRFADYDPSYVEPVGEPMQDTFAAAYAGGNIYGFNYAQNDTRYYIMDAETHEVSYPGATANGEFVYGMAYNYQNETMYAICGSQCYLARVELETGELTRIADITGIDEELMTLAIDGQGNAYALTLNSVETTLVRLSLETGVCTPVASLGMGLNSAQSMTWDHNTNTLLWARVLDNYESGLYTINPITGATTFLGRIGPAGMEIAGLFTVGEPGEIPFVLGDADGDGVVNIQDAILALRHSMGLITLSGDRLLAADVNGSGSVAIDDAVSILRFAMGLIQTF